MPTRIPKTAYIEWRDGLPLNTDSMVAAEGFTLLGCRVLPFTREDIEARKYSLLYKTAVFAGSTDTLTLLLTQADKLPAPLDYPDSLRLPLFMGRQVYQSTGGQVMAGFRASGQPVFVKSVEAKRFTGILLKRTEQLAYLEQHADASVWVSEPISLRSEWRAFIHDGALVDCRPYQGDFRLPPDYMFIEQAIAAYHPAPIAYTLDVGITESGQTVLVEVNDFWAIGAYGLAPDVYARMLIDRYTELFQE